MCWIKGGHTIHLHIKQLLPQIGIESLPFRNCASKVAELQVHAIILPLFLYLPQFSSDTQALIEPLMLRQLDADPFCENYAKLCFDAKHLKKD